MRLQFLIINTIQIHPMKFYKLLLIIHASYILITGAWPLLHIQSFIIVTGPKTDLWLVKTVGALLLPVAFCLLSYISVKSVKWQAVILGGGTAVAFICIDLHYSLRDVISEIYLADAVIEFVFLCAWIYVSVHKASSREELLNSSDSFKDPH